jgi:hypothetical protein
LAGGVVAIPSVVRLPGAGWLAFAAARFAVASSWASLTAPSGMVVVISASATEVSAVADRSSDPQAESVKAALAANTADEKLLMIFLPWLTKGRVAARLCAWGERLPNAKVPAPSAEHPIACVSQP